MRMSRNKSKGGDWSESRTVKGLGVGCLVAGSVLQAQDLVEDLYTLDALTVVGSVENIWELPGSASYIEADEFRERGYTNMNQVLSKVPGVYVREEDGFGNFPNVSLRGADGTRSQKVTIMEDGILSAPSPYAAPAAYYSPKVARMSGIEVLKGSSQVRYGPHTTGGVLNFLSTEIPDEPTFFTRLTGGSYNTFNLHSYWGDTVETEAGRFGYLLELFGQSTDGFRDVDGGGDSGFTLYEPMVKFFWEPDGTVDQRFEVKFGYSSQEADETYLGLSEADVRAFPDRRYGATRFDEFDSEAWRSYFKYIIEPSDALRFETAVYYNEFRRSWDKIDRVNGTPLHEGLLDPVRVGVLNGTVAGTTRNTDNMRDHEAYGWQNQANFRFETGSLSHDLAVGLRLHYDREDRLQQRDTYTATGTGRFVLANATPITFSGINEVFATAVYVEDTIKVGKLTLRPGVRYEHLELDYTNGGFTQFAGDEELFMGGLGASYEIDDCNSVFGGVYRGMSSPAPNAYLTAGTEAEESLGYELGWRHRRDHLSGELVAFATDFDQLISTDAGFGVGAPSQNAGEAFIWGIESLIEYDAGEAAGCSVGIPLYLSATWTSAEFVDTTSFLAGGGDAVYQGGRDGNEIPYVPAWKLGAGVGLEGESWGVNFDLNYVGTSWGTGFNGDSRAALTGGTPTSRDGKIDALLTCDLSGHFQVTENFKLVGGVQNIFDQRGVVSRIPEGPRSNAPRMWFAGFETAF